MCRRRSSPASRSPASTCSRPARWPPPTSTTTRSRCTTPSAASTRRSCCATTGSSGACSTAASRDGPWYVQLMRDKEDVSAFRDQLVFGRAFAEAAGAPMPGIDIAAMADGEQICGCNGVAKGTICRAIRDKGLATLDAVRAHTKASSSCGSCTATVEAILAHVTGGAVVRSADPPICKCTDHGHDAVRRAIVEQELTTIAEVREALGWKTADGCQKCRPALNYYLLCAWPDRYRDDPQSRFVNERVHANIQKDGTYSVVPRMWGGLTNPRELRAIADAAEKYGVPTVKVTGGQRIDLLGVKKEQLPAIWADLNAAGLVSGHAYGKALRTVKTCVGSEWCRFGTQDFDRARRQAGKDVLGVVDAAQGQARGVGLSAQLRRGDDQGCRRGLRRCRLRHRGRRQWRDRGPRHRSSRAGRERGRGAGICRRVPAALPRGGALSRTHRAVGRAGRHRVCPPPDRRRMSTGGARCTGASCSRRALSRRTRGPSAPPAPPRTNTARWKRRSERDAGGHAGSRSAVSTTSRVAARGVSSGRTARRRSPCSAPATTKFSR